MPPAHRANIKTPQSQTNASSKDSQINKAKMLAEISHRSSTTVKVQDQAQCETSDFMRARKLMANLTNVSHHSSPNKSTNKIPFKLTRATLSQIPAAATVPKYNPATITPGILHIGTGGFALAHLAAYVHDLLAIDPSWAIIATSIRSQTYLNALRPQDNLYVLVERENDAKKAHIMAPIADTIFGPANPRALYSRMADANIKMVTMTVTNKGYYLADGGHLDLAHPDIAHDLAHPSSPKSIYGYLAAGLAMRSTSTNTPLTIMSLDNIEQNSSTLRRTFLEFLAAAAAAAAAASADSESTSKLSEWVAANVDFPTTLVDRITPEPTESFRSQAHAHLGFSSSLTIGCESFRQLVVERGRFHSTTTPAAAWAKVGVQVVDSCAEYWQRKFYCLNAGHMIVAACGQRLGCPTVHEAMDRPVVHQLLARAQQEYSTFINGSPSELETYAASIRKRFGDASLNDTVRRVGGRTTSKLSDRLLSAVDRALASSQQLIRVPIFTLAIWLHNLGRENELSESFEADDGLYDKVAHLHSSTAALLASTPRTATHLDLSHTRSLLHSLSTTLGEDRFSRLASIDAFVKTFAWSILAIHRLGLERAASALLSTSSTTTLPSSSPTIKRVASTDPKRDLWKKVNVDGRTRILKV
ncbi:hypothetical protein DFS34DRAFT_635096 [Phlyctochytrium arcticum]|nr:hypothetical protein DFS34DRAFT_635096 [Phlyctochytrium arcticum]